MAGVETFAKTEGPPGPRRASVVVPPAPPNLLVAVTVAPPPFPPPVVVAVGGTAPSSELAGTGSGEQKSGRARRSAGVARDLGAGVASC